MASVDQLLDGKYQIVRLLGEGGMGAVYEATNTWTKRRVAIKTLHGKLASRQNLVTRFWREAQAASQIEHPNIVDVLDMGYDAQTEESFIVQEFLVGMSLEEHLALTAGRRLSADEALTYVVPVALALSACHAAGIIHRDIKPANVFLSRDRNGVVVPKLIDFGISKFIEGVEGVRQTATGALLGTPAYMSPEQAAGDKTIDARTDVWSLGVVLYECLSGQMPYRGENVNQLIGKLLYEKPVPFGTLGTGLPLKLVAAVDKAVEPDRVRRHASMDAFLHALLDCDLPAALRDSVRQAFLARPVTTIPDGPPATAATHPAPAEEQFRSGNLAWSTPLPEDRRRRTLWGVGIAVLTVASVGGGAWMMTSHGPGAASAHATSTALRGPSPPPQRSDQSTPAPALAPTQPPTAVAPAASAPTDEQAQTVGERAAVQRNRAANRSSHRHRATGPVRAGSPTPASAQPEVDPLAPAQGVYR